MAIIIRRELLLGHPGLASKIADWMDGLTNHVEMLHAPRLAQRLREDAVSALESASQARTEASRDLIGRALVASIVAKLTLEWSGPPTANEFTAAKSYERFQECRPLLISDWKRFSSTAAFTKSVRASRRSVENAFSENAQVGPLGYLRIFRLHQVRRQLVNPDCFHLSIGDIAAEHGFWDWSRFSNHYRRHFGELPSETRRELTM
ncbi:helix-turn-helix domain-containing protein [Hoeflea sp. TYP-13]|uniref:helix-turn-helix domain-containing protein n=1 Tax=Hoeflea sp. TYP-13 TaxID=3230023 RepID=UPI0034C69117